MDARTSHGCYHVGTMKAFNDLMIATSQCRDAAGAGGDARLGTIFPTGPRSGPIRDHGPLEIIFDADVYDCQISSPQCAGIAGSDAR